VSATASGDAVLITFRAPDNERTTVYRVVGPDLLEETTITSPRLPRPLHYKLTYNEAKC